MSETRTSMQDLLEVMRALRNPDTGCPWDVQQDFESIAPYTIEEAYEVADAIRLGDTDMLKEELGDLLLQVVFHSQMAEELGLFNFATVAMGIADKMRVRHPHVFADERTRSISSLNRNWEERKSWERQKRANDQGLRPSLLDGVALALPALMRAQKLQKRAAGAGFDWEEAKDTLVKIREELNELEIEMGAESDPERVVEETGDLLFSCVNLARKLDIDAEVALRTANDKFEKRFRMIEERLHDNGKSLSETTLQELDELWQEVKKEGPARKTNSDIT